MENFVTKYDEVISLGNNCYAKMYTERYLHISKETDFFDYIGSPMWSIVELFKNDFTNLYKKEEYEMLQAWIDASASYVTNTRYNLKFRHDFVDYPIKETTFIHFKNKYERRKIRLMNKIRNLKKILFIRLEEQITNKNILEKFKDNYKDNEYEYIKEFIREIKGINPKLEVTVIYLSPKFKNNYIKEDNIITLECDIYQRGENVVCKLNEVFARHSNFIKSLL